MGWKINKPRGPWETEGLSERKYRYKEGMRPLMIVIEPRCIVYRPKGTRKCFRLTHERAYELAAQIFAGFVPEKPAPRRGVRRKK